MVKNILVAIMLTCIFLLAVHAKADARPRRDVDANGNAATVTVPTAAGIPITVAASISYNMQGFISDVVARGYHPRKIHCLSWAKSHVRNSLHHSGRACDFDQCGYGCAPHFMRHVADLAEKWGLRDGCTFGDCGHIDVGPRVTRNYRSNHDYQSRQAQGTFRHFASHKGGRSRIKETRYAGMETTLAPWGRAAY